MSNHALVPLSTGLVMVLLFLLQRNKTLIMMTLLSVTRMRDAGCNNGDRDGVVDGDNCDVVDDPENHGHGETGDAFLIFSSC